MGRYLNPGMESFEKSVNSEIYVDKTGLVGYTNRVMNTVQGYVCVSRPRRFGKSMAANMLTAYYSRGCDSREIFSKFEISESPDFEKYRNKYNTIFLNMQEFLSITHDMDEMLSMLQKRLLRELKKQYPEYIDGDYLIFAMKDVFSSTKHPFVILIDEWDCVFREFKQDTNAQKKYLDFLRAWLKDQEYVALAYMTGILPVKKYGSHSALNMFTEYSMLNPREMAEFFGFTENEVKELCLEYKRNFQEAQAWYDGYVLRNCQVYNPKAVVSVMLDGEFKSYWSETASYEAIVPLINMDYDGLKTAIIEMLSGVEVKVDTSTFGNDISNIQSKDDVLTYMIHLGYLGYDQTKKMAFVPNEEIRQELTRAVESKRWNEMLLFQQESERLLDATLDLDEKVVASQIGKIHDEYVSVIQYHNENSLSSVLAIAYLSSMQYYFKPVRELPTGRGFADFVFIPKPEYKNDYPALVIELKWNQNAQTALQQIKEKNYPESILNYMGNILLVGINYDKVSKEHTCRIEAYGKN